jgi:ectoine hydroxylase-related dioxygenase (phytanoyl-CoA dioxygenase family)
MSTLNKQRFYEKTVTPHKPIDPQTQVFKSDAFPPDGPYPWLDLPDAHARVDARLREGDITEQEASWCRKWIDDGYLILEGFFTDQLLDATWAAYENAIATGIITPPKEPLFEGDTLPGRTLNPHFQSDEIRKMLFDKKMSELVSLLLGVKAAPFQTIMGHKSSEQLQHSDSIHMSTYPTGYLAANWIAFEDIHADSGPLVFHPRSHKLPYLMSQEIGLPFGSGYAAYSTIYEPTIQQVIADHSLEAHYFLPKKGDVLLWHANLLHGGSKLRDPAQASRKALVCHFFAEGCFCYHDLTGMPSHLNSFEFDEEAYLAANPDVAQSGGNAFQHYVHHGRFENRLLRPEIQAKASLPDGFDPALYLAANPDVAAAGADPATHYSTHGHLEGRRLKPE